MAAFDTSSTIDDAFLSVWRQSLVEHKKIVTVGVATFSVRRTAKRRLAQIDFELDGVEFRGLNKIPKPNPAGQKWPARARKSCRFYGQADTSAWSPMES